MSQSSSKANIRPTGHSKTSFLIDDILSEDHALSTDELSPVHGRLLTAAAVLLGTRPVVGQGHASLLTSSTTAIQRQMQAAAFYASTAVTSQLTTSGKFERCSSGRSPTGVNATYLFPNNDGLQGMQGVS